MKKIFITLSLSFGLLSIVSDTFSKPKESKRSWLKPFSRQKKRKQYKLHIDGVECKVCAHTVVSKLGVMADIKKPEFLLIDDDFTKSYLTLDAFPEDVVIADLQKAITSRDMNYVIDAIHGEFVGGVADHKGTMTVHIPSQELSLRVTNSTPKIRQRFKRRRSGALAPITGTVYPGSKKFIFN